MVDVRYPSFCFFLARLFKCSLPDGLADHACGRDREVRRLYGGLGSGACEVREVWFRRVGNEGSGAG